MKIFKMVCLLLIASSFCGISVSAEDSVALESIKIVLSKTEMHIGETQKIKVSVTPGNAENYELEYYSSNPQAVTAGIGTLIAVAEGTAEITVRVKDTEISDTVTVAVKSGNSTVLVTDIELDETILYIERYEEQRIYYTVIPSTAANQNVTFTSQDTTVATVDENGIVYGKRAGNTKIQVQSEDGQVTKYINVYVAYADEASEADSDIPVRSVDIFYGEDEVLKTVEVMRSQTLQFTAQIYPESATDKRIRWKSADEDIAEVDENGNVKGISEGTVKIYAISRDNGRQDVISVKIIPYVRYSDSISIIPQENAVYETGQVVPFTPVFSPPDTTEKDLKWYVSEDNATIDQNGIVTITGKGNVTVKACSQDWKLSAVYTFEAMYSQDHFTRIGESFNVKNNRPIIITFDEAVNINSAKNNIFVAAEETGNTNLLDITVSVEGQQVTVTPVGVWSAVENYIFIKGGLSDIYGNQLNKDLKYKFNIRGGV